MGERTNRLLKFIAEELARTRFQLAKGPGVGMTGLELKMLQNRLKDLEVAFGEEEDREVEYVAVWGKPPKRED